jgi:HAD superfamily hydrolase (TIGR01509 family)
MFEGIIFDCDGVLVDSERIGVYIDQRVLHELGLDFTIDEVVNNFMGKSDKHFVSKVEELTGRPVPENWLQNIEREYREAFEKDLEAVPGIKSALEEIQHDMCVASSGTHEKMRFTLSKTGLFEIFENRIFSASQVERGKPHPDLFLFAAEKMGWSPERCLVVEDSPAGVQAGLAAGMHVVGYAGGFAKHNDKQHERLIVIDDMSKLPGLLNEPLLWSRS